MTRIRTAGEYEQIFEDLMQYSKFTNVKQIKTREDLRDFFGSIKDNAESRGRKFSLTKKLVFEFSNALIRLKGKPIKTITSIREDVVESKKIFISFKDAQSQRLVALNPDKVPVYRTSIVVRKKTMIRFRDEKGRFAKAPEV